MAMAHEKAPARMRAGANMVSKLLTENLDERDVERLDDSSVEDGGAEDERDLDHGTGIGAPIITVPMTAKRAPETSVVRKVATSGVRAKPPGLRSRLQRQNIATAATVSVRKFRPGMDVVIWMTQAETTA